MLAREADRIAADTVAARSEIVDRLHVGPEKVAVAGAGVDDEWFKLPRTPAEPPYLLAVGTVEARKDLETAVRAVATIPDVKLVSAGVQTVYAVGVNRLARELGVSDRVELRGFVGEAELRELYAAAAALVFPSQYEGFGLPPLQALAARLPVVASDIPVLREVLDDCAIFAQPGNVEDFALGMQRVLADKTLVETIVERGQTRARSFTWRAVAQRLVDVYRALA
jgi:glycosyltransferase involved in cell wall biosynthesis